MKALVTGGSGFFGGILVERLLNDGYSCVNIDLQQPAWSRPEVESVQGNLCDTAVVESLFTKHKFDVIFHCAAILAHAVKDKKFLWDSNVEGTRMLADAAARHGVKQLVAISTNCLWAHSFPTALDENVQPCPAEIYGSSKWEAEKVLLGFRDRLNIAILRVPTIIDAGRLGLLSILFDFIREGRKVWVVGSGDNRYQFIYAPDLADACVKASTFQGTEIFNIGSDNVQSLKEVYQYVIEKAGSRSRVAGLPKHLTILGMRLCYLLGISPLGPYHYKMIAENFAFATDKAKKSLGWQPTLSNADMLWRAYEYYNRNFDEIHGRTAASAHRTPAKMGIIYLLKLLS